MGGEGPSQTPGAILGSMTVQKSGSRSWPPARIGLVAITVLVIGAWVIGSFGAWL